MVSAWCMVVPFICVHTSITTWVGYDCCTHFLRKNRPQKRVGIHCTFLPPKHFSKAMASILMLFVRPVPLAIVICHPLPTRGDHLVPRDRLCKFGVGHSSDNIAASYSTTRANRLPFPKLNNKPRRKATEAPLPTAPVPPAIIVQGVSLIFSN